MKNHIDKEGLSELKTINPGDLTNPLDAIFGVYPEDYFRLDSEGRILDCRIGNPAALYLPPGKILGSFIHDVLPDEVCEKVRRVIHQVLQNQKIGTFNFRSSISDKERRFEARLVALVGSQIVLIIREVTEQAEANAQIQRQVQQLSALRSIDAAIIASFDLKIPLSIILQQTVNQLGVDAADVRLLNPMTHMLEFAAGQGFWTNSFQNTGVMIGQGFAGEAAYTRRIIKVADLKHRPMDLLQSPSFLEESFTSYFAVPLIAKGDVKGVLEIYHRTLMNPGDDWFEFLTILASKAAGAIENATLFQSFQHANTELTLANDAVIESWSQALELSGRESKKHTDRLLKLATALASALDMEEKVILQMQRGIKLHGIGKIGIPETILQKPGPLNDEEWEIIRQQPLFAYQLLSSIKYLATALDIPHYHHEKWDGSGYPEGLKGEQIPVLARLFRIVHVYDALTTSRPYRDAWTKEEALEYIIDQTGKQFDPVVVEVFLNTINTKRESDL